MSAALLVDAASMGHLYMRCEAKRDRLEMNTLLRAQVAPFEVIYTHISEIKPPRNPENQTRCENGDS